MSIHHGLPIRWLSALCALLLLAAPFPAAVAADGDTLTVAYIDYCHFIEKGEDGSYTGYGADYLNRIAEYAGWSYQFVDMDWPTAYEAVKAGTVDFYCVARWSEEREPDFDFSLYPLCNEEMNIYTLPDSALYYEDFAAFDGMKIGMLQSSGEIEYFRQYAEANGFAYTLVEYPRNEQALAALSRGEVDAVALVNYSVSGDYKLVGNFGVSPAYLMSCNGSAYMAAFSKAQERLYFDDPDYAQRLTETYYAAPDGAAGLLLTREEAAYIAAAEPITVALSSDMAPMEAYDESAGAFRGVTVDLLNAISARTGLRFRFVRRESGEVLRGQMERGEVRLLGALARDAQVERELDVTQTEAFTDSSFSLVAKDYAALTLDSVVAVPAGYPMFRYTALANGYVNLREYASFDECVRAVSVGEAELTFIITLCENYLLDHVQYADLRSMALGDTNYDVCLGVVGAEDSALLLSILNKSVATISGSEINGIIVANTAATTPKQTTADWLSKNRTFLLIIAAVVLAAGTLLFLRAQKMKQQKQLNQTLQQQHDFLRRLYDTVPCGIFQYEVEAPHRIINCNAAVAKIYGTASERELIGKTPEEVVTPDTGRDFLEKFRLCEESGEPISYLWPIARGDGTKAYTECVLDLVDTERGRVFQEVFIDVTERETNARQVENRYLRELSRNQKRGEGLLYTACFDLDEQRLTQTDMEVPGVRAGMAADAFFAEIAPMLSEYQTPEELRELRARLSAQRAAEAYAGGRFETSLQLCCKADERLKWLRADLALRCNPQTGHLMCFAYIWDITDEHITGKIMRSMAMADCDGFLCVDLSTDRCIQYLTAEGGRLTRYDGSYGDHAVFERFSGGCAAADPEALHRAIKLDEVKNRLAAEEYYQVYATLTDQNGGRVDKALTFFYTDRAHGLLALTVADITEVRAGEVRHARLLSDALAAAEKADAAKGQFLSRVSHEMRTPLNAIIGFIELAKGASYEEMSEYLADSDTAAKHLLSVINDVLDMSSIESGKLKVVSAPFDFKRMLTNLTNIYGTQCRQKDIGFEVRMKSVTEDWLVGDELRLNQILMNLLGNAIKFTERGGIRLTVSQTTVGEDKAFFRFEVSDTGCGISEEMLSRLFRPFEQESSTTAHKYGGSGLGLSIVKSLTGMMGGTVDVASVQGEGTTFTVELPFGRSKIGTGGAVSADAAKLRVLAVDDDADELDYIGRVLSRMGVRFTCADGGKSALSALDAAQRNGDPYNVCLVDWRMPEMNGEGTTRRIRERYGKDVVVIVVSAYDYYQAGEAAKDAGADVFLSKPLFQSSLFDLLMTLTDGKIAVPKEEPAAWDFTGKRVLLVEDNTLNQIVEKGYLAKDHVTVELAVNGQEAVDLFTAARPGYYDAILMDIQMPVMDGLEATQAIRASDHPEAKSIPIIAQTADAFNEDIARALAVGMNAHVAKPIKPDDLAKALAKAFGMEGRTK